ncbi:MULTISPECIES: hypothetical protein [unclassified Clostridium]|jgi:hypothetical protein|uniref:hypothetical protein n=1 Tax=unclassified Clostridium TaxID=2614128 RepID=UPI000E50B8BA|nr:MULTISPECIES: hypothetical protein [unclassified Clostridium]RHP93618.1 hypothetical protein DXA07_05425 [Clostridium sp. AM54-37XD]RHP97434.1 hypothetical protein DXA00_03515 [Clostridium sp. AM54-14XD]
MKLKKKVFGMLAAVLLMVTAVFIGTQGMGLVHAETLKVSINGTELQDGKYYEFGGSGTMSECAPDSLPEVYIYYDAGIIEV